MKKSLFILFLAVCTFANAQYTNLRNFSGATDGSGPFGSLISDGTYLYGMTLAGGANGYGTLFKIMPDGTGYDSLLDFAGVTNGSYPNGSLFYDGTFLYGMTRNGGANDMGTIFKIMPDGTGYLKLLDFNGAGNGSYPMGSLISDGTFLYGMTREGGANNFGTIFKIMPNGTGYLNLFNFAGTTTGKNPYGDLLYDGTFLYGTTNLGGANNYGTIFKIMSNGTGFVNLFDFSYSNGANPFGTLVSDGTFLYGMTYWGGANSFGTLFKIMTDGTGFLNLIEFSGTADGAYPYHTALVIDGIFLYGVTTGGGTNNLGTLFQIMHDGTNYVKLLDFTGTNGIHPYGSLFSDGSALYGMTSDGGTNSHGTIFKYQPLTMNVEASLQNSDVNLFPNPTSDFTTVQWASEANVSVMEVYNATGQLVYTENAEGKTMTRLDMNDWANGIYSLRLVGNSVQTIRVIRGE